MSLGGLAQHVTAHFLVPLPVLENFYRESSFQKISEDWTEFNMRSANSASHPRAILFLLSIFIFCYLNKFILLKTFHNWGWFHNRNWKYFTLFLHINRILFLQIHFLQILCKTISKITQDFHLLLLCILVKIVVCYLQIHEGTPESSWKIESIKRLFC